MRRATRARERPPAGTHAPDRDPGQGLAHDRLHVHPCPACACPKQPTAALPNEHTPQVVAQKGCHRVHAVSASVRRGRLETAQPRTTAGRRLGLASPGWCGLLAVLAQAVAAAACSARPVACATVATPGVLRLRGGMRCVVQRVKSASVTVDGATVSSIGRLCRGSLHRGVSVSLISVVDDDALVHASTPCVCVRACVRACVRVPAQRGDWRWLKAQGKACACLWVFRQRTPPRALNGWRKSSRAVGEKTRARAHSPVAAHRIAAAAQPQRAGAAMVVQATYNLSRVNTAFLTSEHC